MLGAYHAGAWKALERELAFDIVVGVSVGALNGWAIAGGASAQSLIELWLDECTAGLLRHRVPALPWRGFFDLRSLELTTQELLRRYTPRVDFGVVLVEFPRLHSRLVRLDEVTWRHLAASCAVPGGFPPVRVGSRRYVDGGLLCPLPVWAALELGATRVVAVNALASPPSRVVRGLALGLRAVVRERYPVSSAVDLLTIAPTGRLGTLSEAVTWRREVIQRWIEQGEQDALRALASRTLVG